MSAEYQYKIQVPKKIPKGALIDTRGRKWAKGSRDKWTNWTIDGDVWYVWFHGDLEAPEVGEVIEFEQSDKIVETVYWHNRLKRAVVVFGSPTI